MTQLLEKSHYSQSQNRMQNKLTKLRRHASWGKIRLEKVWAHKGFGDVGDLLGKGGDLLGNGGDLLGNGGDLLGDDGDLLGNGGDLLGDGGDLLGNGGDLFGNGTDHVHL